MTANANRANSRPAAITIMAAAVALLSALFVPVSADARGKAKVQKAQIASTTVKRGDTLTRISRRHAVRIKRLIQLNGLKRPYRLRVGQRLRLRAAQSHHRVRRGESVARIAKRYRVPRRGLIRLNNLKAPYRLKIGQKLRLPGRRTVTKRAAKRKPSLERARPVIRRRNVRSPKGLEVRRKVAGAVRRGSGVGTKRGLGRIGKPPALSGRGFAWPLRGRVVGRFGAYPGGLRNDGVNIAARAGSIVRSAENGVVAYTGSAVEGFGELLLIKHAGGWMTAYAHNQRFLVRRGQRVRRGQPVATVGSTGAVIRPQLHFEIRKRNRPIDPLAKLPRNRSLASR